MHIKKYLFAGALVLGLLCSSSSAFAENAATATVPATDVTQTSATINGNLLSSGGAATTAVSFSYGMSASYGFTASAPVKTGTGAFSATLSGLSCGTEYHYIAKSYSVAGSALGMDASFTTLPCVKAPVVKSPTASAATDPVVTPWKGSYSFAKALSRGSTGNDVAALQQLLKQKGHFTAEPNGIYGPLTAKAVTAFQQAMGILPTTGGVGPLTRAALNAAQGGSTVPSGAATAIPNSVPAVATLAASDITPSSAFLRGSFGSLEAAGSATAGFKYGTSFSYGLSVPKATVSGTGTSALLTGLSCGTTYRYAATASNASGTTNGAGMTFTTLSCFR